VQDVRWGEEVHCEHDYCDQTDHVFYCVPPIPVTIKLIRPRAHVLDPRLVGDLD
jgi:hypothetical protein